MANLSLSECESPISHLSGCVIDMSSDCGPFEYSCLDYLESPNCDGTMILFGDSESPPANCNLRVE